MTAAPFLPAAAAVLHGGDSAPELRGTVEFYPRKSGTLVIASVRGLPHSNPSGFFAFHIHEGSSCGGEEFAESGGHYNPADTPHPQHAGDLPPLLSADGTALLAVLTDRFTVQDVIGRTVIIHSGPDDFHSQPAGNPGMKIACGTIQPLARR